MSTRAHSCSLLVLVLAVLSSCQPVALADRPLHEKETAAAWEALKNGKDEEAIKHADVCILEFRGAANRRQKALHENKERVPSGHVTAQQKAAIFKNGTLNDVATCYYIKGRAATKLRQKDKAAKALAEAAKYPSARAWEPRGWFWAPAAAARLFRTNPELADKAPHEVYTVQAWAAFHRGAHKKAIVIADRCLVEFHQAAREMNKDLGKRKVRLPVGEVAEATKKSIFANGLLNDVVTCLFIKGRSAEAKGDRKSAIRAYRAATRLTHGRCWDANGWFWSPAEASGDRLENLR